MPFLLNDCTDEQSQFWADDAKFRLFCGGIGSGKTFAGAIEIARQPAGSTGMVVAPDYRMLKTTSQRTFQALFGGTGLIKSHNKSDQETVLAGGRTIFWRSADDPDKLRGPNLGWIWIDEAAMCDAETWPICVGRLRESPARIWMTTTPRGKRNWLFEQVKKGVVSVTYATSASNKFNPEDFVASVAAVSDTNWQRQELNGEFVEEGGKVFLRNWFPMVERLPDGPFIQCRAWDCATTAGGGDWTVGVRMKFYPRLGIYTIDDVVRGQWGPGEVDQIQRSVATADGTATPIILEQEAGSAGKRANHYLRMNLPGFMVVDEPSTTNKLIRSLPLAKAAQAGKVQLLQRSWVAEVLGEILEFTGTKADQHDDQVDACSLAFNWLFRQLSGSYAGL